ncbi:MAG TPA: MoxR family ATPase [Dyella sp.]|uniref:AAA family ATPase n=1 Tax=Dyella sp. TaxID=1869338 RepID=UPI002D785C46|nr:MoxR family ATPase [Dyella sp.]HET6553431.1 MoxR family ATPase [Dyella sp.]
MNLEQLSNELRRIESEVSRVLVGQESLVEHVLVGLVARGHVLIEGVPGLGKTLLVRALARVLGLSFRRIQFTPDLMPSDITGSTLYSQKLGEFSFVPGPVFTELLLADEVNRAPAKTQSALLEAMQERSVTTDGITRPLADPFLVLATQNPIESQGTYPLPEAQLDRFLMKVLVDYPDRDSEIGVLELVRSEEVATASSGTTTDDAGLIEPERVFEARKEIHGIHVAPAVEQYIMALIDATRHPDRYDKTLGTWIQIGASPRGGIALERTSRVNAWLEGRPHVTPDDVRAMAHGVLRHRIILTYDASAEGIHADQVIDKILELVAVPA